MRVEPASPKHLDALAQFFRAAGNGCFCQFWHFEGDKNAWLERCALHPETNEAGMRADITRGEPRGGGLVALDGEARAIGWLKLAPRSSLPKLRVRPVYRNRDLGPDDGVLSIGCILVHPEARGRGVARALVKFAITHARACGARIIEAYPHSREATDTLRPPEQEWMGPHRLYLSLGFGQVAGEPPYPVLRLEL